MSAHPGGLPSEGQMVRGQVHEPRPQTVAPGCTPDQETLTNVPRRSHRRLVSALLMLATTQEVNLPAAAPNECQAAIGMVTGVWSVT